MTARFVYLPGPRGPEPQVWHDGAETRDLRPALPLQSHDMTEADTGLEIKVLERIYPFKGKEAVDG